MDPTDYFAQLVGDYCEVVESIATTSVEDTLRDLRRLLPSLLAAVQEIPDVEPRTESLTSEHVADQVNAQAWSDRYREISAALGDKVEYWTTSEVTTESEPAVLGLTLADDLADIWRDLKAPLIYLQRGGEVADVVWEWRFGAHTHWGRHAIEALRALDSLIHRSFQAES